TARVALVGTRSRLETMIEECPGRCIVTRLGHVNQGVPDGAPRAMRHRRRKIYHGQRIDPCGELLRHSWPTRLRNLVAVPIVARDPLVAQQRVKRMRFVCE